MSIDIRDIDELARKLNYIFNNQQLLETALTHRSKRKNHNERLEFLGDSILSTVIAEQLYRQFPHAKEGDLSKFKTSLVNGSTLSEMALTFDIGKYLLLGIGELKTGGHLRERVLEDAFEAIIGAIYLDSSFEKTKAVLLEWFQPRLSKLTMDNVHKDDKSKLQEICQKFTPSEKPVYEILEMIGAEHNNIISVSCDILSLNITTTAESSSRKKAEQIAAKSMIKKINKKQ